MATDSTPGSAAARESKRGIEPVNRLDVGPIAEVERIAARRQLELGLQDA